MSSTISAFGQTKSWSILNKLGEGDAGEVYLVESLLDQRQAILKRPRKNAFSTDVIRQATQIENEGRILKSLSGLRTSRPRKSELPVVDIRVPLLLDHSQPGTEFSDRYFIVIEKAPGFDLNMLGRLAKFGMSDSVGVVSENQNAFLHWIVKNGIIPDLILLRAITGILQLFSIIHDRFKASENNENTGVIWNDVKPDHIFWEPDTSKLTVIDWGNAQLLEPDGFTMDRSASKRDDYTQFLETFNSFFSELKPEFLELLKWPKNISPVAQIPELILALRVNLGKLINSEVQKLTEVRRVETSLINDFEPDRLKLQKLFESQQDILSFGEIPDFSGGERFCIQLAGKLIDEGSLTDFADLGELACHVHANSPAKWQTLVEISNVALLGRKEIQPVFLRAISAGLVDDWASVLWDLLAATSEDPEPGWWDQISGKIRQVGLGIAEDCLPPLVILKRNILLMQSALMKLKDNHDDNNHTEKNDEIIPSTAFKQLITELKEEIAIKWEQTEPDPPDAGLAYSDVERLLADIQYFSPEASESLKQSLKQPQAQVSVILDAWSAMEFDSARRGLRRLLLWDPDRRRAFHADRAIAKTTKWLEKIHLGPQNGQSTIDFTTEIEFSARELRNHVGQAAWLDTLISIASQLRKGKKVGELLKEYPEASSMLPWLETIEPRRYIPQEPAKVIPMDRLTIAAFPEPTIRGIQECQLGQDADILLTEPLDTWAPEARGSSARAFIGFLRSSNGQLKQYAVKIMRENRLEYALPLFREEIQVLNLMQDVPGITPILEYGLMKLDNGQIFPQDNRSINARSISGNVVRFGLDQTAAYLSILETRAHQGWLPFIILPKLDNQENLMWLCDAGYTRGRFLPVEEGLRIAVQICDILNIAHNRDIVYRDHKLLHYYWLDAFNGVFMIDWNVAKYHPNGVSQAEIQFDLVQLGARAMHHIFTGRIAPGAIADGPNRVEEIETAAQSYRTQWTYDDQRLPNDLKEILEQLLTGGYTRIAPLQEDLRQTYLKLISENSTIES